MSTKEKENKETSWIKRNLDTDFGKFMLVWIPIMVLFIALVIQDPDSLLTDDQKLQKQLEFKEARELRDQEWEQNVSTPFDEGVRWLVYDRPFPFNIAIGIGLFYLVARGMNMEHHYGYEDTLSKIMNPHTAVPLTVGLFYLLWVTGELENFGIL